MEVITNVIIPITNIGLLMLNSMYIGYILWKWIVGEFNFLAYIWVFKVCMMLPVYFLVGFLDFDSLYLLAVQAILTTALYQYLMYLDKVEDEKREKEYAKIRKTLTGNYNIKI